MRRRWRRDQGLGVRGVEAPQDLMASGFLSGLVPAGSDMAAARTRATMAQLRGMSPMERTEWREGNANLFQKTSGVYPAATWNESGHNTEWLNYAAAHHKNEIFRAVLGRHVPSGYMESSVRQQVAQKASFSFAARTARPEKGLFLGVLDADFSWPASAKPSEYAKGGLTSKGEAYDKINTVPGDTRDFGLAQQQSVWLLTPANILTLCKNDADIEALAKEMNNDLSYQLTTHLAPGREDLFPVAEGKSRRAMTGTYHEDTMAWQVQMQGDRCTQYTFHQDRLKRATFNVTTSLDIGETGPSSMALAHLVDELKYGERGQGFTFPADMFHRSGDSHAMRMTLQVHRQISLPSTLFSELDDHVVGKAKLQSASANTKADEASDGVAAAGSASSGKKEKDPAWMIAGAGHAQAASAMGAAASDMLSKKNGGGVDEGGDDSGDDADSASNDSVGLKKFLANPPAAPTTTAALPLASAGQLTQSGPAAAGSESSPKPDDKSTSGYGDGASGSSGSSSSPSQAAGGGKRKRARNAVASYYSSYYGEPICT